jgi:hypothetical protein
MKGKAEFTKTEIEDMQISDLDKLIRLREITITDM